MLLEVSEFGIGNRVHGFVRFGVESTGVWCCEERFLGKKMYPSQMMNSTKMKEVTK